MDQETQNVVGEAVAEQGSSADEAKLATLRERLASLEGGRPHDYIKALVELADELPAEGPDAEEKVQLYLQAGELYTNKFKNQAEAVRAYEAILEIEATNAVAVDFLRQSYEKRRDWEKLIALMKLEAEQLGGEAQLAVHKEVAQLASDRIKKPAVCIELWAVVLESDPNDIDALRALSQLYERDREYEKFADVLERLIQFVDDQDEKKKLLLKLGQVTGDRLKDDARAAEAYRQLLEFDPDDRRYQEQLKKRYVALGRWDELEMFYAQTERWDEFIRVLESHESRTEDQEQRTGMLMKIAELWMTQKGKPDRAARAYEKILSFDEDNLDAAERLVPIYAAANNAKGLSGAIEVKLKHVEDPEEQVELLRQVAELYQGRAGDKQKAFERLLTAFTLIPGDEQAQQDAEAAAKAADRWDDLVKAYQDALEEAVGDEAVALRLRLGRILVSELKKVDEALAQYQAVCELEPDNEQALAALEDLYRASDQPAELLEVYRRRSELATDLDTRRNCLLEIAKLYEGALEQPEAAIETYQSILLDQPEDTEVLSALDALYQRTGDMPQLAEILARRIELEAEESPLLELKFRLARVQEVDLAMPEAALDNYREILLINQEHEQARGALEGMLDGPLKAEAAGILESIYEISGEFAKLLSVLEILVETTSDVGRQVELLRKIALNAATQLGDAKRAFFAVARALKADPALIETRDELEQFAAQAQAWEDVQSLYTEIAEGVADVALARDYWIRLASIQEQSGKIDKAAASYERLLELDPTDVEALLAMDNLFRSNERWSALVDIYKKRIELSVDESEREQLQTEMAKLYEERLSEPDQAIAAYKEVLATAPNLAAYEALDVLFEKQERWADLAENLEARLTLVEQEYDQIALILKIAQLREERLNDIHSAVDGYRQVLERDPTNEPALSALERLGAAEDNDLMIAEILEPLYRQQGNYQKLINVYEAQERKEQDPESKVVLLHQVAGLYEDALNDPNAAFDTYCRALAVEPANETTLDALERLSDLTQRHTDLASSYESLAEQQNDAELAGQLYMLSADTVENAVGNVDRAVELYRKVLSIDPMNLQAAEALERLFQTQNRFEEVSLILQQKSQILEDMDDQKAALYHAATIEEDVLSRPEKAVEVYHKVLEIDEEDLRSVDALIELYLRMEKWTELLDVQSKKADLVFDPDEKKVIYYQMGSVFERELNDRAKATDIYQRVLELDPDDLEALGRLDALYLASENWNELLSILTRESELTADAGEAVSYQYRIAELYEKHLDDVERAVELYREILNVQPDHAPTLTALEGIKDGGEDPLSAANVLEPVYEASGEYARLIGVLEVQVKHEDDVFGKIDLLHRIATLYEECLMNHEGAFDTHARAVKLNLQHEDSLAELERLANILGRWQDVAALYSEQLEGVEEPEIRVELGMRVAQVYEVQLEQVDQAVARYRQVLELDEENLAAIKALDRLFTQAERWEELVEVLKREAQLAETEDDVLDLKYRLAQVLQNQLEQVGQAIAAYGEVLEVMPEHEESRAALEGLFADGVEQVAVGKILAPLYQNSGEWEKLNEVHLAQLDHVEDPEERLAIYYRLAEDTEEQLLDATGAFAVYSAALAEQPLDPRAGEDIERLAAIIDDGWTQLAVAYADVVSQEDVSAEVQAELGKRLARVYEEELADPDKAKESYRFVLSVSPGDPSALDNLDRIYSSFEEWPELAEVLELRANVADDDDERVELLCRLGEVYEEQLGQLDDAERAYRRIFDDLKPDEGRAIDALARIFEQKEAWEDLARVYTRQLEQVEGSMSEADVRAKLARLSWDKLGKLEDAAEGWRRVVELRGEDGEALTGLADIYEHQQQWAELSEVLERHFEIAETDEERAFALSRRAKLFSEQLGRDDEALETWHRVLDIEYGNPGALRAIAAIWRKRGEPRELVTALHNLVDQGGDAIENEEKAAAFRELGKTYGQVLDQVYEATEAWNRLVEVDPSDLEAIAELEKIYREDENWEEVVRVKMQRADALTEAEERVRELLEVTELWRTQLENYDGAADAYTKILEIEPLHGPAFDELEKLHRSAARWESLIETYLARLDHVEDVKIRSDLWRRMARVFQEKLDDNEQAFVALDQAFKEDFFDEATAEYLGKMAQATGRWKELIAGTQQMLEQQENPKARIQLCLTLGKWYGEDLGMMEYANAYYGQVVELDPGNVRVLRQMANIYRLSGNYQQAGETLQQAEAAAVQNEDRKLVYVDLGDLLRKNMGEAEQSIVYYKRALGIDPHLVPALEALEAIFSERSDYPELADVLRRKIDSLSDAEELASNRIRLAELYENNLNDLERAAEAYASVVADDSTNVTALRGLERAYQQLERWSELVEVLEKQLHAVQSERERVELLLKLAQIQEVQFLKFDLAARRLEQALELDPAQADAYEALERCYKRLKQWEDLVRAYERHIDEVASSEQKLELYASIGQTYAEELQDAEQAITAYQNIVDVDDTNIQALDALAKLYDKRGDVHESIDCLTRVADLTSDGEQRVDMYYRIGKASLDRLEDPIAAKEKFETALDLEPSHLPSLAALRAIVLQEEDWEAAARYLEQEQEYTEAKRAKAKLLVELGNIRAQYLDEKELALDAFRAAIESDPDSEDAALPLVEHYVEVEDWKAAEPLAELLARRAKGQDRAEQHRLNNLLGKIYANLENYDEALSAYQAAFQLDVTSQESIRGIASVAYKLRDWPTALTNYQKVLTALSEADVEERTDVYYRLGCIKREQGQDKQAINNFEKALTLNGEHRPTLDALVEVYEKLKDWQQVAEYKRQILDSVYDDEERYELLVEIGDVWSGPGNKVNKAIEALEEAQELKPNAHVLLHKLLQMYQKAGEWSRMVDTIHSISELEQSPEKKARYYYTMAQLYRDKLEDADRAVELFNEVLDLDSSFLEAFERINKILTASKNWKQLERNYRKMLHRIAGKGKADLEHELWYQLGLVYRDRIADRDRALDAFKMASNAKPDDLKDRHILSELYEVTERYDEAIEQQRYILEKDPLKIDPYRALYRLFLYKRAYDEAWCAASAISFMRKAEPEEQRFFEDYRPSGILQVKGRLGNDHWVKQLLHPEQNIYISKILEGVAGAALKAKIAQLGAAARPPDKKYKEDVQSSTITFARTFGWTAQVLGVPGPDLYVRNDEPGALTALPLEPRASQAGRAVLSGFQPQELAFICGKHLAGYRPELYIRNLFPAHTELTVMLFAGVTIAAPNAPVPQELASNVRSTAQVLNQFMDAQAREYLRTVVKAFIKDGARANIKKWNRSAELSTCRAAYLVSGDLEIARKIIGTEPATPELGPADKMKDLLVFTISPQYAALRRALGINIPVD